MIVLFEQSEVKETESLINQIFSKDMLKMLYYHACRVDIEDNNDKAEMIANLIGPEFQEIGTGTNRIAFLYTPNESRKFRGGAGLVYEFALDRRGFLDNFSEFKRSQEIPEYAVKAYETNMLILVEEYVTLMDEREFRMNENGIKQILEDLSNVYIFEDIGFDMKNFENYGYRENGDIVILDIGYVYPIRGNEKALSCPKCRGQIKYNRNYTGFVCQNSHCRTKYNFLDIRRRMDLSIENAEDEMLFSIMHSEVPDFDRLNINQI
jgi:hypothetical protein